MKGLNCIGLLLMSMAPNMAGDLFTTCPRWHGIGFLCLLVSYIEVHRVFTCCKDHRRRISLVYFSVAATANICFFGRKELLNQQMFGIWMNWMNLSYSPTFSKLFRPSELRGSDHSKVLNLAASRVDFDDTWESQLTRRFQGASISNIKHVVCFDFNRKHVKHMAMTNVLYV